MMSILMWDFPELEDVLRPSGTKWRTHRYTHPSHSLDISFRAFPLGDGQVYYS